MLTECLRIKDKKKRVSLKLDFTPYSPKGNILTITYLAIPPGGQGVSIHAFETLSANLF